jgi:pantothenate kinase-related protein Tda10
MTIPSQATLDAARMSGTSSVGTIDVNNIGGGSLQLMFAKLQLSLAESAKSNAMNYIKDIQKTQEEQKQVAQMLQEARQQKANAGSSDSSQKAANKSATGYEGCTAMSQEMKDYMDKNQLAYDKTGDDRWHSKDEWDVAITSLQARMDSLGTDTQQKMVFVQDYMGQYNSYLQGANSVIQQSNQTLAELARAR